MSLRVETSNPSVAILYSLGCISVCVFVSVVVLSVYKGLLNGGRKRNKNIHSMNAKKKDSTQDTVIGMPCSRDEFEQFMVRVKSSRDVTPAFSSPCRSVEEENNIRGYDKPRLPPMKVKIPLEIDPKRTDSMQNKKEETLRLYSNKTAVNCRQLPTPPPFSKPPVFSFPWPGRPVKEKEGDERKYDKPSSPPLKVIIDPKKTKDNKETYLDMSVNSNSSLYSNVTAVNCHQDAVSLLTPPPSQKQEYERMTLKHIYDNCHQDAVSLLTPPPSQEQEYERMSLEHIYDNCHQDAVFLLTPPLSQERMSLEHIYESIDNEDDLSKKY